jgi:hypothetical protein
MIRRLLLSVALLLLPALAWAGERDALLTPDGTLYAVESVYVQEGMHLQTTSSSVLRLTTQHDGTEQTTYVPASLEGGIHWTPSLAYDSETRTLFVFWQKMPNMMSSELLLCSYHDGTWSEPLSIDSAPYHFRFNLSIGITRQIEEKQSDGTSVLKPLLAVHAVWWDQDGYGERGRYAMIELDGGVVRAIQTHDLLEFVGSNGAADPYAVDMDFDRSVFRQPAILQVPGRQEIEILFADWNLNRFDRVKVHPYSPDGVLHLPVGRYEAQMNPPHTANREASSDMTILAAPGSSSVVLYYHSGNALQYLRYRDGAWSDAARITLTDTVTEQTGLDALKKLASE